MSSAVRIGCTLVPFCAMGITLAGARAQVRLSMPYQYTLELKATANRFEYASLGLSLGVDGAEKADFEYRGVEPIRDSPDYIVASPAKGVAPALVSVALNPNVVPYMRPGTHQLSVRFGIPGRSCPDSCAGAVLLLRLSSPPRPRVLAVVNAATRQPEIAPGTVVSILGTDLSTPPLTAQHDHAGIYPTSLGDTKVTFNGIAAPLLYVSTTEVQAVVPFGVAGQKTADVALTHYEAAPASSIPLVDRAPGIFTSAQAGPVPTAIWNQDGTANSSENPARKGSVVAIFATGLGEWVLPVPSGSQPQRVLDGSIYIQPGGYLGLPRPTAPVTVTIGGQTARQLYIGPAPYRVFGMLQVNAVIPEGVESGNQPVVLAVGDRDNSAQHVVIAVE